MFFILAFFHVIWASTNGKLYKCDAHTIDSGADAGTYCVFAIDTSFCSADATLDCLNEPLVGNSWVNIAEQDLGKAMVANAQGTQKMVSPQPWTEGDQLVATSNSITGDNWAYSLAFSMVAPLRQKMMVTPWEIYPEQEWNKYTRAFTDCLIKIYDGDSNDLSSASVHAQLNQASDGAPTHTYLQYLEEAAIDLVCLMTDLDMSITGEGGRRRLSSDRCNTIRETWGISVGTHCDCWKDAYVGLYGSDPLVEENQFQDCSVVGSTTAIQTTQSSSTGEDTNAGGNTNTGGNGPTCCDGSSAVCSDGSALPCASGAPICADGSNALPPGESCDDSAGDTGSGDTTATPTTTTTTTASENNSSASALATAFAFLGFFFTML